MKILLIGLVLGLAACGAPFTANEFTPSGEAGAQTIGSGAGQGGDSSGSAGAAGAVHDPMARAGAGGAAAGAPSVDFAGAAGAVPDAIPTPYVPLPCSSERNVSGGYDSSFNTVPACLRTREALNTVGCTNWDHRSITVNGVIATCGVPLTFPPSADGYTYIDLGPGSAGDAAIRWFLTAPAPNACSARQWVQGDLYAPGEIMVGVCDAPGSTKSCELGKTYAFYCSDSSTNHCSETGPGANGWISVWTLVSICK
jgi:hypothetical protein